MNKKLNEKYLKQMNELKNNDDYESSHVTADDILCELLDELGYTDLIKVFNELPKWYA